MQEKVNKELILSYSVAWWPEIKLGDENFSLLKRYGIKNVEIMGFDESDKERMEVIRMLLKKGFIINSMHSSTEGDMSSLKENIRAAAVAHLKNEIKLAQEIKARYVVFHPSTGSINDDERQMRIKKLRQSIFELTPHCKNYNRCIALEPLAEKTSLGNKADETLTILNGTDAGYVKICLDVNHFNIRNDLVRGVKSFRECLIGFHISDNDGKNEKHWIPFEGVIDWKSLMKTIKQIGYKGPFTYEILRKGGELKDTIRRVVRSFARLKKYYDES